MHWCKLLLLLLLSFWWKKVIIALSGEKKKNLFKLLHRIWNEYQLGWDTISFLGLDYSMASPPESTTAFIAPSWLRNRLKFGKPCLQVKRKNQNLRPWCSCCATAGTCSAAEAVLKPVGSAQQQGLVTDAAATSWGSVQITITAFPKIRESQNPTGWKRSWRSLSPTIILTLPGSLLNHIPKCHIHPSFKYLQACSSKREWQWWCADTFARGMFSYFVKLPQVRLKCLLNYLFYTPCHLLPVLLKV